VLLRGEHGSDRLALAIGERDPQVGLREPPLREVTGRLGGDVGAAELAQIVEPAGDRALLRLAVGPLELPAALGACHRELRAVLPLELRAPDAGRVEAEDGLVAELTGGLAERA